jgi:tetratricopeptide (TPR) repeat protein
MTLPADPDAALAKLADAFRLQQAGHLDDAEAAYAKLLAGAPNDPVALINAGALALARNDVATAVARLERAVAQVPNNAIARNNLGFALLRAGRNTDALAALDRAIQLDPRYAQAHNNRGIALSQLARRADSIAAFERALALDPKLVDAAINLGDARAASGDHAAARAAYAAALARDPSNMRARTGAAFATALAGELDAARAALEALVAEHPDDATAWQTLAAVANWSWEHERAETAFRRALALAPGNRDAQFGIASTLLARGRFREGFAAFEHRPEGALDAETRFPQWPAWNGGQINGTLLVHGEQGLGDVIQFARFLPRARERAARLVLLVDGYSSSLAPLFRSLEAVDRIVTDAASLASEAIAARASILSLAHLLDTTADDLPGTIPYLAAPADRVDAWSARMADLPEPRVGLAWSVFARDRHAFVTAHKSIPAATLAPLVATPGIAWVSLQPGEAGDPAAFGALAHRISDFRHAIRDFGDTSALISGLDLVIAPDTAVAHLAGAMGKPVWLLDRYNCCWRWRLVPQSSPWYPTLAIHRQTRFGDWTDVVLRVRTDLAQWQSARATRA